MKEKRSQQTSLLSKRLCVLGLTSLAALSGFAKTSSSLPTDNPELEHKECGADINFVNRYYVSRADGIDTYQDSFDISLMKDGEERTFSKDQLLTIRDMGDGYSVIENIYRTLETQNGEQTNLNDEFTLLMATPRGDTLNLDFLNYKDFMLPGAVDMYSGKETMNDPKAMEEANNRWERDAYLAAMRNFGNKEDVAPFMDYVRAQRKTLERWGEFEGVTIRKNEKTRGIIQDGAYSITGGEDLRAEYNEMERMFDQAKESAQNHGTNLEQVISQRLAQNQNG